MNANLLRDAIQNKLSERQKKQNKIPAVVGTADNAIESDTANYIWVRISDVPVLVYCKVAVEQDMNVWVGNTTEDPELIQVLGERMGSSLARYNEGNETVYRVAPHHKKHEYPNTDTVFVQQRAIMPLRVTPKGGFVIEVYNGIVNGVTRRYEIAKQEIDLSEYRIFENHKTRAKYLLIEASATGEINVVEGVEVNFADIGLSDIPDTTDKARDLAAIMIWSGQSEITETRAQSDLWDLRDAVKQSGFAGQINNLRKLTSNLTLLDTENLVVSGYFDLDDYTLELEGDAVLEII